MAEPSDWIIQTIKTDGSKDSPHVKLKQCAKGHSMSYALIPDVGSPWREAIEEQGWTYCCHETRPGWYACGIFDLPENPEPDMYYASFARYEAETSEEAIRCAYLVAIGEMEPWEPPKYQPCRDHRVCD